MSDLPQPLTNLSTLYATDCKVSWASNTTLTIGTGQVRDSTNTYDIVSASTLTLNAATNGANGLDTGSLAASTWYAVFLIFDYSKNNPVACLLSTSSTAPVMPSLSSTGVTYNAFRFIGWQRTDGSSHFILSTILGNNKSRHHFWDSSISVLTAGAATTTTPFSVAAAVPPGATATSTKNVLLDVAFTPATAGDSVLLTPAGSVATQSALVSGSVAAVSQKMSINVPAVGITPTLQYKNSAASGSTSVFVRGFEYFI